MRKIAILLVNFYKQNISGNIPPHCKYHPSCSEYTTLALYKYGFFIGLLKSAWRILRCNPLSKGGLDIP